MAQSHGRNAIIKIEDDGGTVRDLSGDMNSVTLTWTKENFDTMTFGKDNMQRISGFRDVTLTGAGIWNGTETTSIDAVLSGLLSGSKVTVACYAPGGSVSGSPLYIRDTGDPVAVLSRTWQGHDDLFDTISKDDSLNGSACAARLLRINGMPGQFVEAGGHLWKPVEFIIEAEEF